MGEPVAYDFMQEPPFVYPRWLYPAVRQHSDDVHGVSLTEYVLSRPSRGFSEFNVLGAYAFARHPAAFSWTAAGPGLCRWYWSRGGIDAALRRELDTVVGHRR